jgi:chromosome segregation ATPase
MFTYYLVTGIITLALVGVCAFMFLNKTKKLVIINKLQEELQDLEDRLVKSEKKTSDVKQSLENCTKQFDEIRVQRDNLKKSNRELENLVHNCNEVEKQMAEDLQFKANRIKTLESKIAKLKKELKAKEELKENSFPKDVVEEIPQVVEEVVPQDVTPAVEEVKPKKAKRPYKRSQKKQD